MSASIQPFAQSEMVSTFMEGINPELQTQMDKCLSEIFHKYPDMITDSIKDINDNKKKSLKIKLKKVSEDLLAAYLKCAREYKENALVAPILGVVSMLPKDELAVMAETLVSLTSFKRKVSMESETVGGPIDVAVITKGDGFIWIKRKHYFKSELNPQFFANCYKEKRRKDD